MCPHPLNRRITSRNIGNNGIVIIGIKPSPVANLPAGLGIERRVIKDDLSRFPRLEFPRPLPVVDDGQHLASVGASLTITFEQRLRKLLIDGISSLLSRALPGGAGAFALLIHCV